MEETTYIHDEEQLAQLFDELKRGRCDECNEFTHMLIPPYKVKVKRTKTINEETLEVKYRTYRTGFITNCQAHTVNGVGSRPSGVEGDDWIVIDETYFIRQRQIDRYQTTTEIKTYRDNGKSYRYPSRVTRPVYVFVWVKWEDS